MQSDYNIIQSDACNRIKQRRKQMVFSVPPIRLDITSPYPSHSKLQLDMRRKAEILQYRGNSQSSKGNNLTKKQQFSKTINAPNQFRSYATLYNTVATETYDEETQLTNISYETKGSVQGNVEPCGIVYSSSKSSDVPGPAISLFLDPDVPLYNYKNNTESLAVQNTDVTDKLRFAIGDDIYIRDNVTDDLFTISIHNGIAKESCLFEFEIPFSYHVRGTALTDISSTITDTTLFHDISFDMQSANPFDFYTYYNDDLIDGSDHIVEVISDISGFNFNLSTVDFGDPTDISYQFQGTIYGGVIKVSNINLATYNGSVYNFKLKPNINSLTSTNSNLLVDLSNNFRPNPIDTAVVCNVNNPISQLTRMTLNTPQATTYNNFRIKIIDDSNTEIFEDPFLRVTIKT